MTVGPNGEVPMPLSGDEPIIHIAGLFVTVDGQQLRQRCSWCGALLMDHDLTRMAFTIPEGKTEEQARADGDLTPSTWPVGAFVARSDNGGVSYVVDAPPDKKLPAGCCVLLPHEATA